MGAGGAPPPYPRNSIGAPRNLPYKFEEEERGKKRREEEEEEESPLKLNPASVTDGLLHPIRVMTSLTGARCNDNSSRPMVTLTWVPRATLRQQRSTADQPCMGGRASICCYLFTEWLHAACRGLCAC